LFLAKIEKDLPMNPLFTPVRVGGIELSNRLVMAPMTR